MVFFPYISRIHTAYIGVSYLYFRYLKCLVNWVGLPWITTTNGCLGFPYQASRSWKELPIWNRRSTCQAGHGGVAFRFPRNVSTDVFLNPPGRWVEFEICPKRVRYLLVCCLYLEMTSDHSNKDIFQGYFGILPKMVLKHDRGHYVILCVLQWNGGLGIWWRDLLILSLERSINRQWKLQRFPGSPKNNLCFSWFCHLKEVGRPHLTFMSLSLFEIQMSKVCWPVSIYGSLKRHGSSQSHSLFSLGPSGCLYIVYMYIYLMLFIHIYISLRMHIWNIQVTCYISIACVKWGHAFGRTTFFIVF